MNNVVEQLMTLSDTFPFGFAVIGELAKGGRIIAVNKQLYQLCGYASLEEFYAQTQRKYQKLLPADDYNVVYKQLLDNPNRQRGHMFYRMMTKSGELINTENNGIRINDTQYGEVYVLYISLADESENRNIFDQLTGLHERTYLINRLNNQREYNPEHFRHEQWTIICFNILGFKAFNDAYGYDQGDRILKRFADLMRDEFDGNLITRTYADRFIAFYHGDDYIEKIKKIHHRALDLSGDAQLWVEAGIYQWQDISDMASQPNKGIDNALAAAETIHGSRKRYYALYTPEIADEVEKKLYIQAHINEAISKGWIEIYLQPVVRTLTNKVSSFEALSRWNDPVYGMISPGVFVPALEEKNLSYKLAHYVIDQVGKMIAQFKKKYHKESVPISLNLSRRDFDIFNPFDEVEKTVEKYHIKRRQVCIEITESTAMENPEMIQKTISKFHDVKYSVWMDDFGSSYSSLNALKDFEFDEIKLDMAFMRHLNDKGRIIVKNCINMAKELGIHTLCEGVETKDQVEFLKNIGCEKIQGFYYSQPRPADELYETMGEKHIQFESEDEQVLYDSIANMKFETDHSWLLALASKDQIQIRYMNQRLIQESEKRHVAEFFKSDAINENKSTIAVKISTAIRQASDDDQEENISYFHNGTYYMIVAKRLARVHDYSLCKVIIRDATRESRQMLLADVKPVVQSLLSMYDSIYKIDYAASTMEIIASDFKHEATGQVTRFAPEQAAIYLSEKDRQIFCDWIGEERVKNYFHDAHHKFDSHIFHVLLKSTDGTDAKSVEKKFLLMRIGNENERQILLCTRDVL